MKQLKNNPDKFPEGYILTFTIKEKTGFIENFDNLNLKFLPVLPKAFAGKGLSLLATILKSPKAPPTTIDFLYPIFN